MSSAVPNKKPPAWAFAFWGASRLHFGPRGYLLREVSLFTNLISASTLLFAFILLQERLYILQYCGSALVLARVFLASTPTEAKA